MPQSISFDLDGTLVDTVDMNRQCYIIAGVNPPDDFFGRPWQEWLPAVCMQQGKNINVVRARKRQAYAQWVAQHGVRRLAPSFLINEMVKRNSIVSVITGASAENAWLMLDFLGLSPKLVRLNSAAREVKYAWIMKQIPGHLHIDDDDTLIKALPKRRGILYHPGLSVDDLRNKIEETWTPLFSPPAVAND
jgi:hypothetical protein